MRVPYVKLGVLFMLVITAYVVWTRWIFDAKVPSSSWTNPKNHHVLKKVLRDPIHVFMAVDENTILGGISAINSIRLHTQHPWQLHLVTDKEIADHFRYWLEHTQLNNISYEIAIFDPESMADKVKVRGVREGLANAMNYVKYYYGSLFPHVHGRAIHLDADVIVQGDILELSLTKFAKGSLVAYSEDCVAEYKRFAMYKHTYASFLNFNHEKVQALELRPGACSFNAGVYVFDIDAWRDMNITNQLEYWTELNTREDIYGGGKVDGGSQPPMMIVFYGNYTKLDPMWNVRYLGWTPTSMYSAQFIQHAKLLHWSGDFKPWGGVSQYTDIWDRYFVADPANRYEVVRRTKRKHS